MNCAVLAFGPPGVGPLLIVLAMVIIVFGPKRIPALARQVGSGLKELRRSVDSEFDQLPESADVVAAGPPAEEAAAYVTMHDPEAGVASGPSVRAPSGLPDGSGRAAGEALVGGASVRKAQRRSP